jgi:hypothetical protein
LAAAIEAARMKDAFKIRVGVTQFVSLGGPAGCATVQFADNIANLGLVKSVLSHRGQLDIGPARPRGSAPQPPQRVRFTSDRPTARNRSLPVIRPLIVWKDIIRPRVQRASYTDRMVTYSLTTVASRRWCQFTTGHVGTDFFLVLDRQVIGATTIATAMCGGLEILPEAFPPHPATTPRILDSYLKDGPLPFSWRSVSIGPPPCPKRGRAPDDLTHGRASVRRLLCIFG